MKQQQARPMDQADQELQDQASALGRKLGFFINSLNATDEVKQAWLTVVEQTSLPQLAELVDTLETRFLNEQTRTVDEEFAASLTKILQAGLAEEKQQEQKVLAQIQALEQELDKKIKH